VKALDRRVTELLAEAREMTLAGEDERRVQAELEARQDEVLDRWERLFGAAVELMAADDEQQVHDAYEQLCTDWTGPYTTWVDDILDGRSRLPELSAEAMRDLLLAWISPDVDERLHGVCVGCGLECPQHKHPHWSQWKLLPGRKYEDDLPGCRYDLEEFFRNCPHCGRSLHGSGIMWTSRIEEQDYPWKHMDGYVPPSSAREPLR
jgi:hypothetical protein